MEGFITIHRKNTGLGMVLKLKRNASIYSLPVTCQLPGNVVGRGMSSGAVSLLPALANYLGNWG